VSEEEGKKNRLPFSLHAARACWRITSRLRFRDLVLKLPVRIRNWLTSGGSTAVLTVNRSWLVVAPALVARTRVLDRLGPWERRGCGAWTSRSPSSAPGCPAGYFCENNHGEIVGPATRFQYRLRCH